MPTATEEARYVMPRVNILDREDSVVIEADLPGVSKDGVDVNVEDDELTITGRRNSSKTAQARRIVSERVPFDYRRTFVLSQAIDRDKIDAKMCDGVLRLTLQKSDQYKPRRIAVS